MYEKPAGAAAAALGRTLSETRSARGFTLDDVERETRIAKRYLEALEREEFHVLPAPVYCRAFLRTYAQFLGLDPKQVLSLYPEKGKEPEMAPLPQVSKPPPPTLSLNWIISGGVVLILLLAGVLLYQSGSSEGGPVTAPGAASTVAAEQQGAGAEEPNPEAAARASASAVEGEPAIDEATMPDVRGSTLPDGLRAIPNVGIEWVVMSVYSDSVPAGVIISQSPSPDSEVSAGAVVTLTVSRGSS
ncbi:MAG: helix-turn-helix domain-containing protein [Dehalococcoidia bacterium]|nr:helix-turn-helix domain-containing protein [Dehalococcoidia bacterium]